MGNIELIKTEKWFSSNQVIKGISLKINDGELIVFVGPSGCGKSTLLRMIGGLEETSRGQVLIDGKDVTDYPPSKRDLSMVFQSYALYPHLNVSKNMGFPLKTAGASDREISEKVQEVSKILKLDDFLTRLPKTLSGGQRQRVAIGRSIVRNPTAFLFDEPLSNLDAGLRVEMRLEIARLHRTLASTMIYVTHDQVEAMTLADRIVVLESGQIAQIGTPRELYEKPQNIFVAQFIGSPKMNIFGYKRSVHRRYFGASKSEITLDKKDVGYFGIRPEHIKIVAHGEGNFDANIDVLEYLGADTFVIIDGKDFGSITVRCDSDITFKNGAKVGLKFNSTKIHLFNKNGIRI